MTTPLVSIIIPVYNGANFLRNAIDSALAQDWPNLEVLVVNDGSSDAGATAAIAQGYGDRIRYFEKTNGGVSTALNLGTRKMHGDFFAWLSHDDEFYPNKLSAQLKLLEQCPNPRSVLYSDFDILDLRRNELRAVDLPHYPAERFLFEFARHPFVHGCSVLVHRECFTRVGLFDESLRSTQDVDMWLRLAQHYPMIHQPRRLILTRHHDSQGITSLDQVDAFHQRVLDALPLETTRQVLGRSSYRYLRELADLYSRRDERTAAAKALQLAKRETPGILDLPLLQMGRLVHWLRRWRRSA